MKTVLAAFLGLAIVAAAPTFAAEPQLTRSQALNRLGDADAGKRRDATSRPADVGLMSDAKALVQELKDPDEDARSEAEEALWKIWSRSGDKQVDALYAKGLTQMAVGDGEGAVATFTRIIQVRPAF